MLLKEDHGEIHQKSCSIRGADSIFSIFTIHHGTRFLGVFSTKMVQPPIKICQDTTKVPARVVHILIQNLSFFTEVWRENHFFSCPHHPLRGVCVCSFLSYTKFNSPWFFCVFYVKLIKKMKSLKKLETKISSASPASSSG